MMGHVEQPQTSDRGQRNENKKPAGMAHKYYIGAVNSSYRGLFDAPAKPSAQRSSLILDDKR